MRPIEFRGKRLDNGEWAYGSYVEAYGYWIEEFTTWAPKMYGNEIVEDAGEHWAKYEIDPETRGQYTGLKDKNGNKIFEGDIVLADICGIAKFIIKFVKGRFTMLDVDDPTSEHLWIIGVVEVIGNIHENKDLLEGCAKE
ncbi:hypothetical protein DUK53_08600 [Listeria sp. SHR_NRA_18]|uniref:YopX family protein n=1 Tax=Listeria TaxID=1637 RepID=UPI000669E424|nr:MULTISPECIES: YopX family protein [Listeria]KMT62551.1 hypothetical protein X559_1089 [Listeria newyorkensis]RQW66687.1 hypothetical protein DUK53_08600 [Listeria sp. SHR_NRA_18]